MVPCRDGGENSTSIPELKNGGNIVPTLVFWRNLVIQCEENTIRMEPGDIGRPMRSWRRSQIVQCKMEKVPNYRKKMANDWGKNVNFQAEISEAVLQEPFILRQSNQDLLHMQ